MVWNKNSLKLTRGFQTWHHQGRSDMGAVIQTFPFIIVKYYWLNWDLIWRKNSVATNEYYDTHVDKTYHRQKLKWITSHTHPPKHTWTYISRLLYHRFYSSNVISIFHRWETWAQNLSEILEPRQGSNTTSLSLNTYLSPLSIMLGNW